MTREELNDGWIRLQGIYRQMPDLSPAIAREWLRVLEPFDGSDLDTAISMWIARERYKPIPVDLARYCRKAQVQREENEKALDRELHGECRWCGGLGYVAKILEPEVRDVYFYCECPASPNREKGAEILAQARNDAAWYFDEKAHGFRRKRKWIGDYKEKKNRSNRLPCRPFSRSVGSKWVAGFKEDT